MNAFAAYTKSFGLKNYTQHHGVKNLFLAAARALRKSDVRDELTAKLESMKCSNCDGLERQNGNDCAQDRIHLGLVLLATAVNKLNDQQLINVEQPTLDQRLTN